MCFLIPLRDCDPWQPDPEITLSPIDRIKQNKSLWERPLAGWSLLFLNSHWELEELWGAQSTSETELLKIWETFVSILNFPLSGMLSFSSPHRSSSEMSMIMWSIACIFCCVHTIVSFFCHSPDNNKWPPAAAADRG